MVPEFYIPSTLHPPQAAYLVLHTAGDPIGVVNAARAQVLGMDRD